LCAHRTTVSCTTCRNVARLAHRTRIILLRSSKQAAPRRASCAHELREAPRGSQASARVLTYLLGSQPFRRRRIHRIAVSVAPLAAVVPPGRHSEHLPCSGEVVLTLRGTLGGSPDVRRFVKKARGLCFECGKKWLLLCVYLALVTGGVLRACANVTGV
jgi:hypothetical protein